MALSKIIVLHYLAEHVGLNGKLQLPDVLEEISQGMESVPQEVIEAYEALSDYDFWEIVRQVAVQGKSRSINTGVRLKEKI